MWHWYSNLFLLTHRPPLTTTTYFDVNWRSTTSKDGLRKKISLTEANSVVELEIHNFFAFKINLKAILTTSVCVFIIVKNLALGKDLALGILQGKKRLLCCAVKNTCFGIKRTFSQIECDIYDFMSKSIHASKGMSNWNWISVQYSMFYPSYTSIINGKAKLFKYQFDVGNLSFMDFPAFTEC